MPTPASSIEGDQQTVTTQPRFRMRGRVLLLLGLIPLFLSSWAIREFMPWPNLQARFDGKRPFVYWSNARVAKSLGRIVDPLESYDEPVALMSLDTGEIVVKSRADLFWQPGLNARGERVESVAIKPLVQKGVNTPTENVIAIEILAPNIRRRVKFTNVEAREVRYLEFDLPGGQPVSSETVTF